MKRTTNLTLAVMLAAALLLAPLGASAETWTAAFSADAIRPISEEDGAAIIAFLEETSMGLDPDEVDYTYGYGVEGMIQLNGRSWYIGRWTKLMNDGHQSLMTDFLLDAETLQMYPCRYPDAATIEWTDEAQPEAETLGGMVEPVPYLSANGFSLAYDAAYLAPMDGYGDRFVPVTGETGVSFEVLLETSLAADQTEAYLTELTDGDSAVYTQFVMADGAVMQAAVVTRGENAIHYYLLPFGGGALMIVAQCPTFAEGEWGARFDLMAESITY